MKLKKSASLIAAIAAATATIAVPAANSVTVGPGSPIRMPEPGAAVDDGRHVKTGMCSTGVPGTVTGRRRAAPRDVTAATASTRRQPAADPPARSSPTHDGNVRIGESARPASPHGREDPAAGDTAPSRLHVQRLGLRLHRVDGRRNGQPVRRRKRRGGSGGRIVGADSVPRPASSTTATQAGRGVRGQLRPPHLLRGSRTGRNCGVQVFRVRRRLSGLVPGQGDSGATPTTRSPTRRSAWARWPSAPSPATSRSTRLSGRLRRRGRQGQRHFAVENHRTASDFRTIGRASPPTRRGSPRTARARAQRRFLIRPAGAAGAAAAQLPSLQLR